jgi:hypothetical protein
MTAVLAVVFLALVWLVVIWGSVYFNRNVV